jgi:hypothetical protein
MHSDVANVLERLVRLEKMVEELKLLVGALAARLKAPAAPKGK